MKKNCNKDLKKLENILINFQSIQLSDCIQSKDIKYNYNFKKHKKKLENKRGNDEIKK
ncbi:hypothetical protein ALANTH_1372 [Aliarcobacter lanthieri]|nr:hypothetical protein ALANTH_1372 [Aliarcobacter lanthieri]